MTAWRMTIKYRLRGFKVNKRQILGAIRKNTIYVYSHVTSDAGGYVKISKEDARYLVAVAADNFEKFNLRGDGLYIG